MHKTLGDELLAFLNFIDTDEQIPLDRVEEYLAHRDETIDRPTLSVMAGDGLNGLPMQSAADALRAHGWDVYEPSDR